MKAKSKILIVDDDAAHRRMLDTVLTAEGYRITQAGDGEAAVQAVQADFYDVILMDLRMPRLDGLQAQQRIRQISPGIPIIMMTAYASVETAVGALKAGASDYLTKPVDIDEFKTLIDKILHPHRLELENVNMPERLGEGFNFSEIIGRSPAMSAMLEILARVAPTDATVLIDGESGTGKELVANAIHRNSPRREHAFIKVNCAALPETLLESELFGHEKGAFTGALSRKPGRFLSADRGSIFLDEIGEMSPATQAKVLRVLQDKTFQPVGADRTIKVDVRIIAATNKDLPVEIAAGAFREDLYYRLNVVQITAPPLRERREDIPLMADHFLRRYAEKNRRLIKGFTPRALDLLMRHEWPGNVRELENVIERAVIMTRGETITPAEFPEALRSLQGIDEPSQAVELEPAHTLRQAEKQMILRTLEQTGGNRTRTAQILEISRRSLQLKLKEYGIN
jgi:two-component system response regulator HydG